MKKVITLILMAMMLFSLCSCGNRDVFDTVKKYNKAIIAFPDGTSKTIEVKQWRDYDDGDQLQITAKDGTVYLVHAENCILVREK